MFRFSFIPKKGDIFFSIIGIAIFCGLLTLRGIDPTLGNFSEQKLQTKIAQIFKNKNKSMGDKEVKRLANTLLVESRKYKIDPFLLLAIIETESSFSNSAVSNKNARGLMQIIPATAKDVAMKEKIKWEGYKTLHTPATNIKIGTHYFNRLLNRFDGNVEVALSAYNNGPTRVAKILKAGNNLPRKYSKKVLTNYKKLQETDGV